MSGVTVGPRRVLGSQLPTHRLVAAKSSSAGADAIGLAELVGTDLDPWQKALLRDGLGVRDDGRWAAREVFVELSRQNGKSVVLEMRALVGIFLLGERLVVYSAHEGKTAMRAFRRLQQLIQDQPELKAEVASFRRTNGQESIELHSGAELVFRTRTAGGGRGLDGDCVILDEAQELRDEHIDALLPTIRARPNPQIWYAGSAGDQDSVVQARLVRRVAAAETGLTAYRWAASEDDDASSVRTWAKTNPALGRRIDPAAMAQELRAMGVENFRRELLGMGTYPRAEGEDWVIPRSAWEGACLDENSSATGRFVLAVDAKPDRTWASVSAAGRRRDGGVHVEVIEHARGLQWLVPRVLDLRRKHPILDGVVIDPKSSAHTLVGELEAAGVPVLLTTAADMAAACGGLYDSTTQVPPTTFHRGAPALTSAVAAASTRRLGDAFAWNRHGSADISPLVSVTLARWGLLRMLGEAPKGPPQTPLAVAVTARTRSETADLATASF